MRSKSGFTLVELIVVVVIAVILLAVALPTMKYSLEEGKLREGARQVNGFFASAKARAATTGRPAGVWLEVEQLTPGLYQCSQLYLAEVPAPYTGDVQNAICLIRQSGPPWAVDFQVTGASLEALVGDRETFRMQLDGKGRWLLCQRNGSAYAILAQSGFVPNQPWWFGPDEMPGMKFVDDDGNGFVDDLAEWGMGDDGPRSIWSRYSIHRQPVRSGQPLELPRGIVIDLAYSGLATTGNELSAARGRVLVMFSPGGGVASVSYMDSSGNIQEDIGASKVHLLIGRTEQAELPWQNVAASNIADGGNLWVTVNRRSGAVGTIENAPDATLPFNTSAERQAYLATAREFATTGEVKSGQ